MGSIFLTSDTHFGHDREFLWGPRGFRSYIEHDEAVIANWNSVVGPEDTVYVLGDLMLGDNEYGKACVARLNGHIKLIRGNHDTDARKKLYETLNIEIHRWAEVIKYKKYNFYLSHFPTLTGNLEKESLQQCTCNLFGHTHQITNFHLDMPYMYHVGVDSHNCYPVLLDDIIVEMYEKVKECLDQI